MRWWLECLFFLFECRLFSIEDTLTVYFSFSSAQKKRISYSIESNECLEVDNGYVRVYVCLCGCHVLMESDSSLNLLDVWVDVERTQNHLMDR